MVESEGADLLSYSSGSRSSAGFLMRFLIQGLSAPAMVRVYRPSRAAFTDWSMAADDGIGIVPDKIPYLFDRYYRVDERGGNTPVWVLGSISVPKSSKNTAARWEWKVTRERAVYSGLRFRSVIHRNGSHFFIGKPIGNFYICVYCRSAPVTRDDPS